MHPFSLLVKPAGAACNLVCDYCFYLEKSRLFPSSPRVMPLEVLERVVSSYLALPFAAHHIAFQGGEPLLAGEGFFRVAAESARRHARPGASVSFSVQTNGTLLTESLARFFASEGWLAGLSIDGPAAMHDAHRVFPGGAPSHGLVLRAAETLRRAGCEWNALALVARESLRSPAAIYRHLRDRAGADWIQFTRHMESVDDAEWDRFLCETFETWRGDGDEGRVGILNIEAARAWAFRGEAASCIYAPRCDGYFVVEKNGDVFPCDFKVSQQTRLGNIMEEDWENMCESKTFLAEAERKCPRHASFSPPMRFYDLVCDLTSNPAL